MLEPIIMEAPPKFIGGHPEKHPRIKIELISNYKAEGSEVHFNLTSQINPVRWFFETEAEALLVVVKVDSFFNSKFFFI